MARGSGFRVRASPRRGRNGDWVCGVPYVARRVCRVVQECCLVAYVARAVCVRWTYYGVSRLARGDGMLWVAGGQQRGPGRARACMCVPRTCELSVSVT